MRADHIAGVGIMVLALAACASPSEPITRTVEVKVPVARSCVPKNLPPPPVYPDTDAALRATAGVDDLLKLLGAGRLLRIQRAAEVEPVVEACR